MRAALPLLSALTLFAACAAVPHEHHAAETPSPPREGLIRWYTLAEGKDLAWVLEKPMVVDFHVPSGCPRCERMDAHVWNDPEIAREVNEDFVPVRVDLSRPMTKDEKALGERYDFNYDCLLLFLDFEGKVIKGGPGGRMCFADFVDPKWFLKYLGEARAKASPPAR